MAPMGRILLLVLIVVAVILVWKAFGPGTWNNNRKNVQGPATPQIKGPDDDENFLWELDKKRFKERRAREREQKKNEDDNER